MSFYLSWSQLIVINWQLLFDFLEYKLEGLCLTALIFTYVYVLYSRFVVLHCRQQYDGLLSVIVTETVT